MEFEINCETEDDALENIAFYLQECKGNKPSISNIRDAHAKLLAVLLPQCKNINSLALAFDEMGAYEIENATARALIAALPRCKKLNRIKLSGDFIDYEWMFALPRCATLAHLCLEYIEGIETILALAAALPQCEVLSVLELGGTYPTVEESCILAAALPQCSALNEFSLSGYDYYDFCNVRTLIKSLPRCKLLAKIKLSGIDLDTEDVHVLVDALAQCKLLTDFYFKNFLKPEDMQILVSMLPRLKTLHSLDLLFTPLCFEGGLTLTLSLATALPKCTALAKLHLDAHLIQRDGARELVAALPQCVALATLDLRWDELGAEGMRALATALPQCAVLTELNLTGNSLGCEGVQELATALPRCAKLSKLYLSDNNVGCEGARALAAVLPRCVALTTLYLCRNKLGYSGAQALENVIKRCERLVGIYLSDNNDLDEDYIYLVEGLVAHRPKILKQQLTMILATRRLFKNADRPPVELWWFVLDFLLTHESYH